MSIYKGEQFVAGVPDTSKLASIDLNNLSTTGQGVLDNKADVDLSNLSEEGLNVLAKNGGSSLPLFSTILMDKVLDFSESKGYALQGTYVYKEAVAGSRYGYPDFVAKCIEEMNAGVATETTLGDNTVTMYINSNGHQFYNISDKDAIDTWFNTYGIADFYGVDTENQRVFLPRNKYFMQLTVDTTKVNEMNEAGLPNITGAQNYGTLSQGWGGAPSVSGAYKLSSTTGYHAATNLGDPSANIIYFDASLSNSIYGNSDTVQPPSSNKLLYYVVGNTEQESSITDVIDVTTTENDTTPLGTSKYMQGIQPNLSWLASNGQWNDGNMYLTFYNYYVTQINQKFAGGYVKDSTDTYDDYDLVINQSDMTFRLPLLDGSEHLWDIPNKQLLPSSSFGTDLVAAQNGILLFTPSVASGESVLVVTLNGKAFSFCQGYSGTDYSHPTGNTFELIKGDVYKLTIQNMNVNFIPYVGTGTLYFKVGNAVVNQELIDIGEVTNALALKQDKCIHIIDTYVNGTSGYIIYSNGYCEQWGWVTGYDVNITITFLKPFLNTDYCVTQAEIGAAGLDQFVNGYRFTDFTTTTMICSMRNNGTKTCSWRVCGYVQV